MPNLTMLKNLVQLFSAILVMKLVGAGREVRARPGVFVTQSDLLLREAAAAASIARPSSGLQHQTLLPS